MVKDITNINIFNVKGATGFNAYTEKMELQKFYLWVLLFYYDPLGALKLRLIVHKFLAIEKLCIFRYLLIKGGGVSENGLFTQSALFYPQSKLILGHLNYSLPINLPINYY